MYPRNSKGDLRSSQSSSSMGKSVEEQEQEQLLLMQTRPSHAMTSSISAFRNLSLSSSSSANSPPEKINHQTYNNRNNGVVDAAAYLPQTLDDSPMTRPPRNGGHTHTQPPIRSNHNIMAAAYYPLSSLPQHYFGEHTQRVSSYPTNNLLNGFSAEVNMNHNLNLLAPYAYNNNSMIQYHPAVMSSPRLLPTLYPSTTTNNNNVPLQGGMNQHHHHNHNLYHEITQDMLPQILNNPFVCMTNSSFNRPLNTFLTKFSSPKFIDDFVVAITSSQHSLLNAARNYYGSSLIQTLIKVGKKRSVIGRVPQILADDTLLLMTDQSGMHVIKQCFIELEEDKYRPLYNKMIENDNWLYIAKDKHGCRGLNECLDYLVHHMKDALIARIAVYTKTLALDVYGTYIVQHVIDIRTGETEKMVRCLLPFLEVLCTTKNGSHLVEKCLDTRYGHLVIKELVEHHKVVRLALHECANYVIQRAIRLSREAEDRELHERLVRVLWRERSALQVNKYGKYVVKMLPVHHHQL